MTSKIINGKLNIMEEILIPLGLFASIVVIVYVYYTGRNKERLALIEKGENASVFDLKHKPFPTLKLGMFLVGVGLGFIVGNLLANFTALEEPVAYFSMILLLGGGSLITFFLIERKKNGIRVINFDFKVTKL
jgi:hypothetical protein